MGITKNHPHVNAECVSAQGEFRAYAEGTLSVNEARALEAHLHGCPSCRKGLAEHRRMFALMDRTIGSSALSEQFDRRAEARLRHTPEDVKLPDAAAARRPGAVVAVPALTSDTGINSDPVNELVEMGEEQPAPEGFLDALARRFGAAPWWIVSGSFHALLIMLLFLIGMVIMQVKKSDTVIVTSLEKKPEQKEEEKERIREVFENPQPIETTEIVPNPAPVLHEEVEVADHTETDENMDSHDAFGDEGISDIPLGGSGVSAAIGVGGGGSGAFGRPTGGGRQRLARAMAGGGNKATESAVDKALEWLARHQEADGHWDCWKYEARQEGRTQGINGDAACTGFALLAFLGAGHTEKVGKYKDNVKRGTEWLVQELEKYEKTAGHGRWCSNHGSNYTQGVAAMALAEAAAMGRNPKVRDAAQRAIDGVVAGQIKVGESEYHAWDYKPGGHTNDTSVTGWNIMALKSAKIGGLQIDPAAFEGAMRWINSGQVLANAPQNGDAEYWEGGMMTYRGRVGEPPRPKNMAMTSAAALTRILVGGEGPDHPGVAGPCNLMKKEANLPTENVAHFNLYYWYYGTLVMFQKGGDHWKAWNDAMKPALLNTQRKDGDFDGSWNPYYGEPQGHIYGGRVMSTALGALCLEVYYRYLPLHR